MASNTLNLSRRRRYYRLKEQGLCVGCCKKTTDGKIKCDECRKKHSLSFKKNKKKLYKKIKVQNYESLQI